MQKRLYLTFAVAGALAVAACGMNGEAEAAAGAVRGCPSADEARKSVEAWERKNQLTEHNRSVWHIVDLKNFQFSEVKFGGMTRHQVQWGVPAQSVCPARFTYTYDEVTTERSKPRSFGENKTFYFWKDSFGDWVYKHG